MKKTIVHRPAFVLAFLAACLVAACVAPAAMAQPRPQEEVPYRILSVDANSWVVTAEDLETGSQVRFKLNPRAFVKKRFKADVGGQGQGQRFSVVAPRNEPLPGCCELGGGPPGDTPSRRPSTTRPSAPGRRAAPPASRPEAPSARPGGPTGGVEFEIVEVDPRTWMVTANEVGSGLRIQFQVDPTVFVGYEFRANLRDLRTGQGFGLVGLNNSPLSDCCTLLEGGQ